MIIFSMLSLQAIALTITTELLLYTQFTSFIADRNIHIIY